MEVGILFFLWSLFLIFFEAKKFLKSEFDYLTLANLFFLLSITLPGFFINLNFNLYAQDWAVPNKLSIINNYLSFIIALIGYLFFYVGYQIGSKKSYNLTARFTYKEDLKFNRFTKAAVIFGGLLSAVAILVYTGPYGSVINALKFASAIRAGYDVVQSPFAFFKRFMPASVFPLLLLCNNLFNKQKTFSNRIIDYFFVIILFVLSILGFLLASGRANIIILFFLIFTCISKKVSLKQIFFSSLIFYAVTVLGDVIFNSMRNLGESGFSIAGDIQSQQSVEEINPIVRLVHELQYPYVSLCIAIDKVAASYRYFLDFIWGALSLFPDALTGEAPATIAYYNTQYITGIFDSEIPPGIFAFSYYSLGLVGVIALPFLWGRMGRYLQNIFTFKTNLKVKPFFYYWAIYWSSFILNGEPRVFFQSHFMFMFYFLIFMIYVKKTR